MNKFARRVLVVDDNPHIGRVVTAILQALVDEKIKCCTDARQGLAVWRAWRPDLVLVDFEMEPMSGVAFTKAVRQAESEAGLRTTIVMMTAHSDRRRVLEARASGVDDLVAKPLTLGALLLRVGRATEGNRSNLGSKPRMFPVYSK